MREYPFDSWPAMVLLAAASILIGWGLFLAVSAHASSISNGGGGGGGGTGNAGANVTTTFSATPTFTCPSSTAGTVVSFTLSTALTANITSSTLATCTNGSLLNFIFTEDATGGRTVVMPAGFDAAVVNPAANISSKCTYFLDGAGNGNLTGGGCVSTAGYGFGSEAAAPGTPPAASCFSWFDSTNHVVSYKCNNSATISNAVVPVSRPANQFLTSLSSAGVLGTNGIVAADVPAALSSTTSVNGSAIPASATIPQTVAAGQTAMPTAAVSANSCSASATTAAATNTLTTDAVEVTYNTDPTGITGYGGGTSGGITVRAYPTANTMNFKLCNETGGSITPGALTLNWRVVR